MIADTFENVLKATNFMEESLKLQIREIQAEVLREQIALQRGSVTSSQALKSKMLENGFSKSLAEESWKGIIDASGKRWDLTTYTKMVSKTKLMETQLEATKATMRDSGFGHDLAVISSHGAKDSCGQFEAVIVSLEGRTRGYKTLAEVRASGLIFHPNCQHSVHAIGDMDVFPQKLKDKAKAQEQKAEKALANPEKAKAEDNARRYKEKKAKQEEIKRKRKEALEKARATREAKRRSQ